MPRQRVSRKRKEWRFSPVPDLSAIIAGERGAERGGGLAATRPTGPLVRAELSAGEQGWRAGAGLPAVAEQRSDGGSLRVQRKHSA
jgi:hypothetical protein